MFVAEYVKDFNGTQAAKRAGYSSHTANEQAARLLAKASIQQAVARAVQPRLEKLGLSLDASLSMHRRLAYAQLAELFDEAGELRPMKDWPKHLPRGPLLATLLAQHRLANKDLLEVFKAQGEYGAPPPPPPNQNLTINNTTITVVPLERLTDDELRLYLSMLEKQRAIPIEALTPPATPEGSR